MDKWGAPGQTWTQNRSIQKVEAGAGELGGETLSNHAGMNLGKLKPKWNQICSKMSKDTLNLFKDVKIHAIVYKRKARENVGPLL